jgi:hypothetical protein
MALTRTSPLTLVAFILTIASMVPALAQMPFVLKIPAEKRNVVMTSSGWSPFIPGRTESSTTSATAKLVARQMASDPLLWEVEVEWTLEMYESRRSSSERLQNSASGKGVHKIGTFKAKQASPELAVDSISKKVSNDWGLAFQQKLVSGQSVDGFTSNGLVAEWRINSDSATGNITLNETVVIRFEPVLKPK